MQGRLIILQFTGMFFYIHMYLCIRKIQFKLCELFLISVCFEDHQRSLEMLIKLNFYTNINTIKIQMCVTLKMVNTKLSFNARWGRLENWLNAKKLNISSEFRQQSQRAGMFIYNRLEKTLINYARIEIEGQIHPKYWTRKKKILLKKFFL